MPSLISGGIRMDLRFNVFGLIWLSLWFVVILRDILIVPGVSGINTCSNSMRYRDLCPNPMFVSRSTSLPDSDLTIHLTRKGDFVSHCNFHKNPDEGSVIGGIHVAEYPWSFHNASNCNHVVKMVLDPHHSQNETICQKDLGFKVFEDVYFWHNFSLTSTHLTFVDLITNYGHSPSDLQCSHSPKYLLLLILTSRNLKCSLLIQQYKVDQAKSGCDFLKFPSDWFCGAYHCSQVNTILHKLKLISRRIKTDSKNSNYHVTPEPEAEDCDCEEGDPEDDLGSSTAIPLNEDEKEIDWNEWVVRLLFPCFGIGFIFFLLYTFRARYADEICGRVGHRGSTRSRSRQDSRSNISMEMDMEKQGVSFH